MGSDVVAQVSSGAVISTASGGAGGCVGVCAEGCLGLAAVGSSALAAGPGLGGHRLIKKKYNELGNITITSACCYFDFSSIFALA